MAEDKKPYRELREELDSILDWFDNEENLDIDSALAQYERAARIIRELQAYLKDAKSKITKIA